MTRKPTPVPPKAVKVWLAYHKMDGQPDGVFRYLGGGLILAYGSRKDAKEAVTNTIDYGFCEYRISPVRKRKKGKRA